MSNIDMYCVTNKQLSYLEKLPYNLAAVGKDEFNKNYINSNTFENIFYKEKNYSELAFHYWYWKNKLKINKKKWIGFCQKRRFWIDPMLNVKNINNNNFMNYILINIHANYDLFDSIICSPIKVSGVKKMKLIKRGWRNIIRDPSIFFDEKKQNILLHFDMHHGFNNLKKAIDLVKKEDKNDFFDYVNNKTHFNPHIMFIAKPTIVNKWFNDLFPWLTRCEKIFGFNNLKGYDTTRLYAYLAERYLSFWFKKYTRYSVFPYFTLNI